MKKAIIFFLGVITGRYLITFVDRLVSILFYGHHDTDYIPFTKPKTYATAYTRPYTNYSSYTRPYTTWRSTPKPNAMRFHGIIFDTSAQAEGVLNKCIDSIDKYGFCSVRDFKTYAKDTLDKYVPSRYSDIDCIWTDLKNAKVVRTHSGYEIDFPETEWDPLFKTKKEENNDD